MAALRVLPKPSSVHRHDNAAENGSVKIKAASTPRWVRVSVPSLTPDHPFNGGLQRNSDQSLREFQCCLMKAAWDVMTSLNQIALMCQLFVC